MLCASQVPRPVLHWDHYVSWLFVRCILQLNRKADFSKQGSMSQTLSRQQLILLSALKLYKVVPTENVPKCHLNTTKKCCIENSVSYSFNFIGLKILYKASDPCLLFMYLYLFWGNVYKTKWTKEPATTCWKSMKWIPIFAPGSLQSETKILRGWWDKWVGVEGEGTSGKIAVCLCTD